MIRTMIVDDEPRGRDALARLIEKNGGFEIVEQASSGNEALQKLSDAEIDVVFLDVEMPGMNGLEVAIALSKLPDPPLVVFATAYEQYAVEAFDSNAIDYVLKPFEAARLEKTFARIKEKLEAEEPPHQKLNELAQHLLASGKIKRLVGHKPKSKARIIFDPRDVSYFETDIKDVRAHLDQEDLIIRSTLQDLMEQLDNSQFAQTHKGYVVNLAKVQSVEPLFSGDYTVLLKGPKQERIPLSRRYVASLKNLLGSW